MSTTSTNPSSRSPGTGASAGRRRLGGSRHTKEGPFHHPFGIVTSTRGEWDMPRLRPMWVWRPWPDGSRPLQLAQPRHFAARGRPVDFSWRVRREGSVPAALSSKSRGDARFRRARLAYSGIQSTPPVMTTWSVALMDTSLPRGCDGAATPLRQGRSAPPRGRLAVACTGKRGFRPGRGWGRPCE
jgi:hypothetical protein